MWTAVEQSSVRQSAMEVDALCQKITSKTHKVDIIKILLDLSSKYFIIIFLPCRTIHVKPLKESVINVNCDGATWCSTKCDDQGCTTSYIKSTKFDKKAFNSGMAELKRAMSQLDQQMKELDQAFLN